MSATVGFKKGDTIVEVMFAFAIFALVAIIGLTLMNLGIQTAQASLEHTMARNEIFVQAEAIRFIHSSFVAELNMRTASRDYTDLWDNYLIRNRVVFDSSDFDTGIINDCVWNGRSHPNNSFVINHRNLGADAARTNPNSVVIDNPDRFAPAELFPRILFNNQDDSNVIDSVNNTVVSGVEGLWVAVVAAPFEHNRSFFDFHIRACWRAPGKRVPSQIGTVVRVYNPRFVRRP